MSENLTLRDQGQLIFKFSI